jgi:hypothetical protein
MKPIYQYDRATFWRRRSQGRIYECVLSHKLSPDLERFNTKGAGTEARSISVRTEM